MESLLGIDIGGTFTDIVYTDAAGHLKKLKRPSTRLDPSDGLLTAVQSLIDNGEIAPNAIDTLAHGTTVATNAIIERAGATVGIITTEGFRDVLEIGRQGRRDLYDTILKPQTPVFLAPRSRRLEVIERVTSDGDVLIPLNEESVLRAADDLAAAGCQSIAVILLFSFANPTHERRVEELIAGRHPHIQISLSCDVDPTFREYERTCATVFDAYVKPLLGDYLHRIEASLDDLDVSTPLQVIHSRGGLCSSEVARRRPVRLVLSGPAAGVTAGARVGSNIGRSDLVTIDIGGTSSDIALVAGGQPLVQNEGQIDGFPVRIPMADIHVIGAGGGSIAAIDSAGALCVGPQSAGSEPGPACYGRGGVQPTVTDASVVLGYLDPNRFGGGSLELDVALAQAAIKEKIAEPLDISVEQAALGIHRVLNTQMAAAIRLMSVNRGLDPRKFSLLAMGGAGPMHATSLVEDLGLSEAIIPPWPGVGSALGLLFAPVEHEMLVAQPTFLHEASVRKIRQTIENLDRGVAELMKLDQVPSGEAQIRHSADVCFVGQAYTLEIGIDGFDMGLPERLYEAFVGQHYKIYGHAAPAPARIVNLRAVHRWQPERSWSEMEAGEEDKVSNGERAVWYSGQARPLATQVVPRSDFRPGETIQGPHILEQTDTTVLLPPKWRAQVMDDHSLVLTKGEDT